MVECKVSSASPRATDSLLEERDTLSLEICGLCFFNLSESLQVDFHDTSRGLRVPSMTDYFGFTMAAMNDKGSIFANPQKGEKNPSTLLYRPFNSWTNNSEVLNTVVVQTTQKHSYCWVL